MSSCAPDEPAEYCSFPAVRFVYIVPLSLQAARQLDSQGRQPLSYINRRGASIPSVDISGLPSADSLNSQHSHFPPQTAQQKLRVRLYLFNFASSDFLFSAFFPFFSHPRSHLLANSETRLRCATLSLGYSLLR